MSVDFDNLENLMRLNRYLGVPGMTVAGLSAATGLSAWQISRVRNHKLRLHPYQWRGLLAIAQEMAAKINPAFVSAMLDY